MAAGLVTCLLCPTVLVADLVCDHCAASPMGHDMKRAMAARHGMERDGESGFPSCVRGRGLLG